ncbi:MAG: hypothetical protein SPE05_08720 [Bacteroidales bacterium]|nr:hypothetical protein [Bacteroidales bacterium]
MKVELKTKQTLKGKGEAIGFSFSEDLKVSLFWSSKTDLDLCLFYRKKEGGVGGVFAEKYRNRKDDMGSLNKFPFIELIKDQNQPEEDNEAEEQIFIRNLDEIDEAYIVVINYNSAKENKNVTFADEGGRIELKTHEGAFLEVRADSEAPGFVYCVCYIKNVDGENTLIKCGGDEMHPEVMDLETAFKKIPGFSKICKKVELR